MTHKTAHERLMELAENGTFKELDSIDRSGFPVDTPNDEYSRYFLRLQYILNKTLEDHGFRLEYLPLDERYGRGGYFTVTYLANCIFPPETGIGIHMIQGRLIFKIDPKFPVGQQIESINTQFAAFKKYVYDNRRTEEE